MVDRITPNTAPETLRYLKDKYGIDDEWAVSCEDFIQWVLEDNFKLPPGAAFDPRLYEKAGVQIVRDVEPYELMKMRLLNASHSALAYSSYLMGYRQVDRAAKDPLLRAFIRDYFMEEITPTLKPVPGIDLAAYKNKLISRFSNEHIADQVLRLAEDGSKKIPTYVLGALQDTVRLGLPHRAILLALACWARFLTGADEQGTAIPIKDPQGTAVIAAAPKARSNPLAFLRAAGLHGLEAAQETELAESFGRFLEEVYRKGAKGALEGMVGEG
jgi:mannitol 2-dehydrogenase